MWLIGPEDIPDNKLVSPLDVVTDALYGVDPKSMPAEKAREILDALHRAGYRIAVKRKQWR